MAIETVHIDGELYYINQKIPQLGCDELGQGYIFDDDYRTVTVIRERVDEKGRFYSDVEEVGVRVSDFLFKCFGPEYRLCDDTGVPFSKVPTEVFILLCRTEINPTKHPTGVNYLNGDKSDFCSENLEWIYAEDSLDTGLWLKLFLLQSTIELLLG